MRSRTPLFLLLAVGLFVLPHFAHAAIPFFGPIVPEAYNVCPGGYPMFMAVVNNIIQFALTIIVVFILPIRIAYAGFLMVSEPMSPGGHSKAKDIVINTLAGVVIALAAWMIVDAVMAVLYKSPDDAWGTWTSLMGSGTGDTCLQQAGALPGDVLNQATLAPLITGVNASGSIVTLNGQTLAQCSSSNSACSPTALQSAGFTPKQANIMSCIAATENAGNAVGCNGHACGTFQIMLSVNPLVGAACSKYPVHDCTGASACNKGKSASSSACEACIQAEKQAANDSACNAQAARNLYAQSGYGPWTTFSDNKKSAACVQQYGG